MMIGLIISTVIMVVVTYFIWTEHRLKKRNMELERELEIQKSEAAARALRGLTIGELVERSNERARLKNLNGRGRSDPKKG